MLSSFHSHHLNVKMMMKETMDGSDERVNIGRDLFRDVRFADDQVMIESTENWLQLILNGLNKTSQ